MQCRRVSVHDRERVAAFVERLPRESSGLDIGKNVFEMKYDLVDVYLRNLREKKMLEVLVAEEDSKILGICDLRPERYEEAFLHLAEIGIMVASDAQGRGVGSALLSDIGEKARDSRIDVLIAYVRKGNIASERLFLKGGYEIKGVIPCYFKFSGKCHDGLIFWRKLDGC